MRTNANIDILPMAAVGLILVLVMMVVAPMVVTRNNTPVVLPQTHTAERKTENDISITLNTEGYLFLDDRPVADFNQLEEALRAAVSRDPYVLVVIRADKDCLHERVLDVLATARRAGAQRIACATKRLKEG